MPPAYRPQAVRRDVPLSRNSYQYGTNKKFRMDITSPSTISTPACFLTQYPLCSNVSTLSSHRPSIGNPHFTSCYSNTSFFATAVMRVPHFTKSINNTISHAIPPSKTLRSPQTFWSSSMSTIMFILHPTSPMSCFCLHFNIHLSPSPPT